LSLGRNAVTIRPADPTESDALGRLAREAKAFWGYSATQLELWRDDLAVSSASVRRLPTFVATLDGAVAGVVQIGTEASPWELEHLWVGPRHMRRGVGRALLARAVEVAARAGQTMLAIDADPHAEAFYLAVGARRIGEIAAPIMGQGDRVRPQLLLAVGAA
jgi:GNAT superfamily N-acetyltransferase